MCIRDRVGPKKLWWCKAGYVLDMATLECLSKFCYVKIKYLCVLSANKTLKEECELNEQCTGTENGNTCRLVVGTDMKECSCNDQFEIIDEKCLKGNYEGCPKIPWTSGFSQLFNVSDK